MSSFHALSKADDNVALSTPNFFNSAWNPDQSGDFSFTDNQGNIGNYDGYTQNYNMGNRENDQLDYFSGRPGDEFATPYQSGFLQGTSNDDIGQILTPGLSFLNMDVDREIDRALGEPNPYSAMNQMPSAQSIEPYPATLVFGQDGLEALPVGNWSKTKPQSSSSTIYTENGTERETTLIHGQVTPGDSPLDGDENGPKNQSFRGIDTQNESTIRSTRGKRSSLTSKPEVSSITDESAPKPAKKARKSKKKPITREQEEAKRKRFLERNRVAADKCRQNRKKWIDDLQEKCHSISADNAAKKIALDEMEHELMQMKNMLMVHSQTCKDHKILDWVNTESRRMQDRQAIKATDSAKFVACVDAATPLSQSSSSSSRRSSVESLNVETGTQSARAQS